MQENNSRSHQLHESVAQIIANTSAGDKLPSEPELAVQLNVSRASLREVLRTFETQGIIHRRQGVGTFVMRSSHILDTGLELLESIESQAQRLGLPVSMGEFTYRSRIGLPDETSVLGLPSGTQVKALSRVILIEEQPVAYLVDILPNDLFLDKDIEEKFQGSILDLLLKEQDLSQANSRCEIQAVSAPASIARALKIKRGAVLLQFTSQLFTRDGRIIGYSLSYFVPGYFRFHVMRRIIQYPITGIENTNNSSDKSILKI